MRSKEEEDRQIVSLADSCIKHVRDCLAMLTVRDPGA